MVPLAVALGLTPTAVLGLPNRVHVLDVMESGQLPQDVWCMQAMDIFHTGLALPNGRTLLLKAEMEAPLKFL